MLINLFSLWMVILKRLWHNLGISLSAILGILSVLAIAVCVPVFSHSVSGQILKEQLLEKSTTTNRRLFSLHLYFIDNKSPSVLDIDKAGQVTEFIRSSMTESVGLPVEQIVLVAESGLQSVVALSERGYERPETALARWRFLSLAILPQYADMVEGEWPQPDASGSGPIRVALPVRLADEMDLEVGDRFQLPDTQIEVAGFWRARNVLDPIWFNNPEIDYAAMAWVPEETYRRRVAPLLEQAQFYTSWYVVIAEGGIRYTHAVQYLKGLARLDRDIRKYLPGIEIDYSPIDALQAYQGRSETLTTQFMAVGAPMVLLALMFIALTARIAVQQYENEIATMRGRGASRSEVMGMNLVESLILVAMAVLPSLVLGWLGANLMRRTVSFLKFTQREPFPFSLEGINLYLLLGAIGLILLARFLPAIGLSRITIIRLKQEQSRATARPIWERFYLDFLLLVPGLYALFVMQGWAKPAQFLANIESSGSQWRDPLLFVAPAVFAIACCMILLRIIPLLLRGLAALTARLPGVWAYLSLEQVARRPEEHASALLLIMISLSLSIFSASSAKTLDQWLFDSEYYKAGADLNVQEFSVEGGGMAYGGSGGGVPASSSGSLRESSISIEEHEKVPMIQAATRVGKYAATYSVGAGEIACLVMGIDRLEFPEVGYFRDDFADQSLGALMNALAIEPFGVLMPAEVAEESGVDVGDTINVSIDVNGVGYEREMVMVGTYRYFPTIYPADKPTLVTTFDSIFDNEEAIEGVNVWINLRSTARLPIVLYQLRTLAGGVVNEIGNAVEAIQKGRDQPERMGLFGILNVGFLMTGLMPGIGFVLYSYASLRKRFIQLGILQAIGLSVAQLVGYLVSEQFILMGLAIGSGAGVGLLTSQLFVPFLQIGAAPGTPVPPFKVLIGWAEAGWLSLAFGVVLLLTIAGTVVYLVRLKVFQAVKLGETL